MNPWIVAGLIILALVFIFAASLPSKEKQAADREVEIARLSKEHSIDFLCRSTAPSWFLGISFSERLLFLNCLPPADIIPFSKLLAVEVAVNAEIVSHMTRDDAMVDGGPAAWFARAGSGEAPARDVNSFGLRLTLDDPKQQQFPFVVYTGSGIPRMTALENPAVISAGKLHAHLVKIMREPAQAQVVMEERSGDITESEGDRLDSKADELRKLWDLHMEGALTAVEYQAQKRKLLS